MNDHTAFIEAIRANPADAPLRLVYADWLEERGDPRGEFLRLQSVLNELLSTGQDSANRRARSLQARLRDLRWAIDADWLAVIEPHWWEGEMDGVNWNTIEHAYGPAEDVPAALRAIAWGDEAEALGAFGELPNNLNHQGSIYPATGPAVPYVIEALRVTRAGPGVRAGLLNLLAGIASGASEATSTSDGGEEDEAGAISFCDVLAGVWRGGDLYLRLLSTDPDADVACTPLMSWAYWLDSGRTSRQPGSIAASTRWPLRY